MGSSPSEFPDIEISASAPDLRAAAGAHPVDAVVPAAAGADLALRRPVRADGRSRRRWSAPATTRASSSAFSEQMPRPSGSGSCCCTGLWYSAVDPRDPRRHEFGHYFACRYYRVDASLPYFLPMPLPADRHARRLHPHPRSRFRASARCSTSASPDRSPASSSPFPCC